MYGGIDLSDTVTAIGDPSYTASFAWFISNYPEKFINATTTQVFDLNYKNSNRGLGVAEIQDTTDVYYNSAMCMHHGTGNNLDGYKVKLSNIIDIESPGIIKIYKCTPSSDRKSYTVSSATYDLTNETTAKNLWTAMGQSSSSFDQERMKRDISGFAYLISKATESKKYSTSNSSGVNDYEEAMYIWWGGSVNGIGIREYIDATGKMDSIYGWGLSEMGYIEGNLADSRITEAKTAVANILEEPSLTEVDTGTKNVEYIGGKAYIGPLKANFSGGTPIITVEGNEAKWVTKNNDGTYNAEHESSELVSGQVFYAVVDEDDVKNEENADVKLELSYEKYKARLVLSTNRSDGGQCIMFHAGEEVTGSLDIDWSIEQTKKVTIQKQDASGNALNVAGIEFKVYDSEGNLKGTLTTGTNGKTGTIDLERDKTYKIKETKNQAYGYKNITITSATMTSNTGTISVANNEITVTVTSDTTISIRNQPTLGKVTLEKENTDGEDLQGVKFVLYQAVSNTEGYIKLYNGSTFVSEVTGEIDITDYTVQYLAYNGDISTATKFVTNSEGKISIDNLEKYAGVNTLYNYAFREVENPYYGYDGMSVTAKVNGGSAIAVESDGDIPFDLSTNTAEITIIATNEQHIGDLEVLKVTENDVPVENVEFVIKRDSKYIQLKDGTSKVEEIKGTVSVLDYTTSYVTNQSDATVFITDVNGKITIQDLEIDASRTAQYSYTAVETNNPNYGYGSSENDNMQGSVTQLQLNTTTQIKLTNNLELGDLEVNKVDKDDSSKKVSGVEFIIEMSSTSGTKYIALHNQSGLVTRVEGIVTINSKNEANASEYHVEYVANKSNATTLVSDSEGKVGVRNLEVYAEDGTKYKYKLIETSNTNYGYTVDTSSLENVSIELLEGTTAKTATNEQFLGDLSIKKVDKDYQTIGLENVEFILSITSGTTTNYIALYNQSGAFVESVKGTATINEDNVASSTEYHVEYVSSKDNATIFITDENGEIHINNLEVYDTKSTDATKYTYKLIETSNANYGYTMNTSTLENVSIQLNKGENEQNATNEQFLGGLSIKKIDEEYPNIVLEDVEFVMTIKSGTTTNYIALYDQNGQKVESVKGAVAINNNNVASSTEYRVEYVANQADATIFKTDENGEILVNNLEVFDTKSTESTKYTYRLTETYNPYYGYEEPNPNKHYFETTLTKGQITAMSTSMTNLQEKMKISGYVWEEKQEAKSNEYNCIYVEESNDIKLSDLYIMQDGVLIKNPNAYIPVEIKLYDRVSKEYIKTQPDEFNTTTGEYTFVDVEVANLANYDVVFEYDGVYYTTVVTNLELDNGSKVKEVSTERDALSNQFGEVRGDGDGENQKGELVATDGTTVNTVEYMESGNVSIVSGFSFDATLSANTAEAGYSISDEFHKAKTTDENGNIVTTPVEGIDNVNMGIVLREQPEVSINSDMHSVLVQFEGYNYNYVYNERWKNFENTEGNEIGVEFENRPNAKRYTQTVYTSDIQAAAEHGKQMKVYITYQMKVSNDSRTLNTKTRQIINYFDSEYVISAIGLGLDKTTNTIIGGEHINFSAPRACDNLEGYSYTIIDYNQDIEATGSSDLYIRFEVTTGAIYNLLLQETSTYHNVSEIISYTTYYGDGTALDNGIPFITDQTPAGNVYAGIDKVSQPGNIEPIVLIDHPSTDGTKIPDTTNFEADSTAAPSLLLRAVHSDEGVRKISGSIWEDTDEDTTDNEKIGDGIYQNNAEKTEYPIANVKIQLHKVNSDGTTGDVATYSDTTTPAITTTDENGNYTFGYFAVENGVNKFVGVLPGRYVIKYTYNNESYIVTPEGNKHISVNDYKSTIITSNVIKAALNKTSTITYNTQAYNGEKWYVIQEGNRYSDAVDNRILRQENNVVKYSTYANNALPTYVMDAYTPVMDIGIEFTRTNEADAVWLDDNGVTQIRQFVTELENVDFGIIERPDVDIKVDKEITGLEIVSQTGSNIVPKGNPSNPNAEMQYVKKLDELVSAEIETNLLQSAQLNIEYTITIKTDCQIDYEEDEYYYYGRGGITLKTAKITKVVDYLDATMKLDESQNPEGVWISISADELKNQGLISDDVYNELTNDEKGYTIMYTEYFNGMDPEDEESTKVYASRALAVSDSIRESNSVEIIELVGGRVIKESTPGNYIPREAPSEPEETRVVLVITPPTGTSVNYTLYIISTLVTFAILVAGILIIKKKIIR